MTQKTVYASRLYTHVSVCNISICYDKILRIQKSLKMLQFPENLIQPLTLIKGMVTTIITITVFSYSS